MARKRYIRIEEIGHNLLQHMAYYFSGHIEQGLGTKAKAIFRKRKITALAAIKSEGLRDAIVLWLKRNHHPSAAEVKAFTKSLRYTIWDLGLEGIKAACKAILLVKVATQDGGVDYKPWDALSGQVVELTDLVLHDVLTALVMQTTDPARAVTVDWKKEGLALWIALWRAATLVRESGSWVEKVQQFMPTFLRCLLEVQKATRLLQDGILIDAEDALRAHSANPTPADQADAAYEEANEMLLSLSAQVAVLKCASAYASKRARVKHARQIIAAYEDVLQKLDRARAMKGAAPDELAAIAEDAEGAKAVWEVKQAELEAGQGGEEEGEGEADESNSGEEEGEGEGAADEGISGEEEQWGPGPGFKPLGPNDISFGPTARELYRYGVASGGRLPGEEIGDLSAGIDADITGGSSDVPPGYATGSGWHSTVKLGGAGGASGGHAASTSSSSIIPTGTGTGSLVPVATAGGAGSSTGPPPASTTGAKWRSHTPLGRMGGSSSHAATMAAGGVGSAMSMPVTASGGVWHSHTFLGGVGGGSSHAATMAAGVVGSAMSMPVTATGGTWGSAAPLGGVGGSSSLTAATMAAAGVGSIAPMPGPATGGAWNSSVALPATTTGGVGAIQAAASGAAAVAGADVDMAEGGQQVEQAGGGMVFNPDEDEEYKAMMMKEWGFIPEYP